jgi:hypothetical protein
MAHREFVDAAGVQWQVWEVIPSTAERRGTGERRFGVRDRVDRRVLQQPRAKLDDGLAQGWLVFECATEKRRLHPIPEGWSTLTDLGLAQLAEQARPAAPSTRTDARDGK